MDSFPGLGSEHYAPQKTKKPTWRNTRRYSATSAYSSTSPPAQPGCSPYSHPTTSLASCDQVHRNSSSTFIVRRYGAKAIGLFLDAVTSKNTSLSSRERKVSPLALENGPNETPPAKSPNGNPITGYSRDS